MNNKQFTCSPTEGCVRNEFIDKVKVLEAEAAVRVGLKGVVSKIVFLPSWKSHMADTRLT